MLLFVHTHEYFGKFQFTENTSFDLVKPSILNNVLLQCLQDYTKGKEKGISFLGKLMDIYFIFY